VTWPGSAGKAWRRWGRGRSAPGAQGLRGDKASGRQPQREPPRPHGIVNDHPKRHKRFTRPARLSGGAARIARRAPRRAPPRARMATGQNLREVERQRREARNERKISIAGLVTRATNSANILESGRRAGQARGSKGDGGETGSSGLVERVPVMAAFPESPPVAWGALLMTARGSLSAGLEEPPTDLEELPRRAATRASERMDTIPA